MNTHCPINFIKFVKNGPVDSKNQEIRLDDEQSIIFSTKHDKSPIVDFKLDYQFCLKNDTGDGTL